MGLFPLLLALGPVATGLGSDSDKVDLVVLENGNTILGELKSLQRGTLRLKTDSAGTLSIEWDEVLRVTSPQRFRLETAAGDALVGTLPPSDRDRVLVILGEDGEHRALALEEILWISEYEHSIWERVDGHLDAGISFNKASDVTQLTFGAGVSYFERYSALSIESSAIVTDSKGDSTSRKLDLTGLYKYYLEEHWFALGAALVQHNSELDLDLRNTVGAGPGRFLVQDQVQELSAFAGLAVSHEIPEGESSTTELEGLLGTQYDVFITDTPETQVNLSLYAFPGITDSNRIRTDLQLGVTKELVEDFFLKLSFYLDYDSAPISSGASKTDYGIVTGISYTW